jgi:hypothetical protein
VAELPFVEKYRPESLEDIVGDSGTEALRAFVKTRTFPLAMILYGAFGTGKTARARALVRDYYVLNGLYLPSATFRDIRSETRLSPGFEGLFPPVLYVDASVTRDIEFIKDTVQEFMKTVPPMGLKKFIIFDEADRLSFDAQGALRPLIEKYPNTVTIYTTNDLDRIDPAIQDRAAGATFEVKYPGAEFVAAYLQKLAAKENVEIPLERLREIAVESESVRQAVGKLGTEITVYRALHAPPPTPPAIPQRVPEKAAEKPPEIPAPTPPPVPLGLSDEQKKSLEDAFKRVFEEAGVKDVPLATFRDELERLQEDLKTTDRARAYDLAYRILVDVATGLLPKRPKPEVTPPAPTLAPAPAPPISVSPVEMFGPRRRDIITVQCWVPTCLNECVVDKDLMRRVTLIPVLKAWSPRGTRYEPLLPLPPLFFYSCEEHKEQRFGYRSVYDALAYLLVESRSSTKRLAITKGTFADVGLDQEDINIIQSSEARWIPK